MSVESDLARQALSSIWQAQGEKMEELDELLGIAHLSFDSIKSKRSSMIRTINDNGRLRIERIRKEDDKRFFKYSIN